MLRLPKNGAKGPGLTYIPPCNANITNTAKPKPFTLEAKESASTLPVSFSWNNQDDVKSLKGNDLAGIIMPPQNQYACGSCYAFSTTSCLSDRVAILQKSNPALGPTYLMSYGMSIGAEAIAGCNGGGIQESLQVMSKAPAGTVPTTCWGYEWCINDSNCSSGGDGDQANSIIPRFNSKNCLDKNPIPIIYHVLPHTVFSIGSGSSQTHLNNSFMQIRQHIFDKGPMPTGFIVFSDFFLGTAQGADNWGPTGNIYVHLEVDSTTGKSEKGDPFPYTYGCAKSKADCLDTMQTQAGGHAVAIVGWGVADVPNFLPVSHKGQNTISLPYWVVRNSWGTTWNEAGYFRIACTNVDYGINTEVKFDNNIEGIGGPIDFDAAVAGGPVPKNYATVRPSKMTHPSLKTGIISTTQSHIWLIILGIIIASIAAYFIWKRMK